MPQKGSTAGQPGGAWQKEAGALERPLWVVIIAAGAVMALAIGFRQSLGLFLTPISLSFGGSRAEFALGIGLMNLFWGLASPFAGAFADRYGAGRVAAFGGLGQGAVAVSRRQCPEMCGLLLAVDLKKPLQLHADR